MWEWEAIVGSLAVVVTVLLFLATRARDLRLKRADLLRSYTADLYASAETADLFMDIDHERFTYDDATFLGTSRELALIKLLDYFNAVGYYWRRRVLLIEDILPTTIAYALLRTWEDPSVRRYLQQIKKWDEERFIAEAGFQYFEELAIVLSLLRTDASAAEILASPTFSTSSRRIPVARRMVLHHPVLFKILQAAASRLRVVASTGRRRNPGAADPPDRDAAAG
ncbi:hypothetical protein [Pseudonocardia sp.]|uniref:hypothetical protein n=1 Tax=Pseudonocardia sp. TaxID=60912 RepID=UPI003D0CB7BC